MSESKKYLFVCTIGPVQDFIATARTSHDLWFGSWMLSELSKAAARSISDEPHQLIFPAPEQKQDLAPGSALSVANKIVAIVEGDPTFIADQVLLAVNQRLKQLYKETYDKISDSVDQALAEEQINDLIEFYWASSILYTDEQGYKKARARAEALLAARKNTRNFRQVTGHEDKPKSSLDGFRESVLPDKSKPMDDDRFYAAYHAEPGEALSGIDLLKRWGESRAASFPSTTDVAAVPFLIMLGEKEESLRLRIRTLLKEYTGREETAGTYFYAERLVQLIPDRAQRSEFRRRFAEIFREEDIRQPSPHYALLLADGDNMGKTIDAQDDPEKHRKLSQRLSEFASTASQMVINHGGVPIYVGGDDVLAYLPLHTALECVSDLNTRFNQAMQEFSFSDSDDGGQHSPTLSGGLVIAHHLTPLSDVLDMARRAEKQAKRIPGKNALVIISSKRGGADRTASAKMNALIERMQVLIGYTRQKQDPGQVFAMTPAPGMQVLIGYTRQKQISASTAYELQNLHQQLSGTGLPSDAFQREAIRIIQRKRESGGEREIQEKVQQQFKAWFKDTDLTLEELAQEMVIAGEFARACEMADISSGIREKET